MERNRPKILIVYDVGPPHHHGWAQYRHAAGLAKYTPDDLIVHAVDYGTYSSRDVTWLSAYSAVYVIALALAQPHKGVTRLIACVASHAWMYHGLDLSNWRTYGVNRNRCLKVGAARLKHLRGAICRNRKLASWAKTYNANVEVFPLGLDRDIFNPGEFRADVKPLRIGWCGQTGGITNFKGHTEILRPLQRALPQYDWSVNTRMYTDALPAEEMAEWYRSLDVFLCTSSDDGSPNPPFEAAACGVPVVSTDMGQVSDWEAMHKSGMIVPNYGNELEATITRDQIANRLKTLEDPKVRCEHRERLLASVDEHYDYAKTAPDLLYWLLEGE